MNANQKPARHRTILAVLAAVLIASVFATSPAHAAFGLHDFDVTFTNADGTAATQAGSHPHAVTASFGVNNTEGEAGFAIPDEELKTLVAEQIAGLSGDLTAIPHCKLGDFLREGPEIFFGFRRLTVCPDASAVGLIINYLQSPTLWAQSSVYNLEPPPGVAVRLGFKVLTEPVTLDVKVKQGGDYNVVGHLDNAPQVITVFGGKLRLWGNPQSPSHDKVRGGCGDALEGEGEISGFGTPQFSPGIGFVEEFTSGEEVNCPGNGVETPFLTLPRACTGPKATVWHATSWSNPGAHLRNGEPDLADPDWVNGSVLTHDDAEPPNPQGFTGCGKLGFNPRIDSKVSTDRAESGGGLDFSVDINDEGLKNAEGLAQSEPKKAEVILPEGVTINPSIGEGLGVCTPADLERETLDSKPGEGCPNSSKVGSLHAEFPIIAEPIDGSIFLAQQDDPTTTESGSENPFDSLIALYFVLKNKTLGVNVKLPVLVEPDPLTGQLVVTLNDIPQFPFSHFNAHLREGVRAALVTPPTCGTHTTEARLYPWSDPDNPRTVTSSFEITRGVNGGPCPPGGVPPFNPGFQAGSVNNNAGSYSPFNMRLIRNDGEQNMTKFSSILPPGVLGSLAGVAKCPDVAVDVARAKTGRQELAAPSCPVSSQIGRTLAGAGVGSALTYVPGYVYLAGPYKGAPLSVISITPAVAGPFDAGTVVVRLGLDLDPKTAEVSVDGAASDPIPHIIKGIVLKVRDLRVYVDRPNFTLNPTSCDESSAKARLFGSFLNVLDPADDFPVDLATRYQAANCLNLGFDPKLGLRLKGGTKRGGHPGLRAVYSPKPGDANIEGLVVSLPRSAFLDQAHIRTICTRVQYAAEACPKAAQYGYIRAWTPLLDTPLQGPVWLRSSNHKLPDLVFDLKGLVDIEVSVRIDSARGGIRATLVDAPDAPLSRVVLNMQGGKKGLIINSRNLCARKSRANVRATGHNGQLDTKNPVMRPQCKKRKAKRSSHGRALRSSVASSSAVG